MTARPGEHGFTLIELMISLGLFALIAVAGMALLDSVLGVQGRTEKRLDRLADLQRAMFVVTSDLDQIATGDVRGGGTTIDFARVAPGLGGQAVPVRYEFAGGALVRYAGGLPQPVLNGVQGVRWRFFGQGWQDAWPLDDKHRDDRPRAVEMQLDVAGPGGEPAVLRRVVALPARAQDKVKPS